MIVLYGINQIAKNIEKNISDKIIYACTNGAKNYNSSPVLSLIELSKIPSHKIKKIIICSMYTAEISESLLKAKFPIDKIYFYNCNTCNIEPVQIQDNNPDDILYAILDLKNNLVTYDVANFFYLAEQSRIERKKENIVLLIVPNKNISGNHIANTHYKADDEIWRIEHIITPLARCVPAISSILSIPFREHYSELKINRDNIFPNSYSLESPPKQFSFDDIQSKGFSLSYLFDAPEIAKKIANNYIKSICKDKLPIVITLREYDAQVGRNSDLYSIEKFISSLDNKYQAILIRDTYKLGSALPHGLSRVPCCDAASIDLQVRVALNQLAFLNFSVNTGPSYIFAFTKNCSSIEFRWVDDNIFSISRKVMAQAGFKEHDQPIFFDSSKNSIVWERDSLYSLNTALLDFENSL